jgi:L-iditol 2-dehydrogenase
MGKAMDNRSFALDGKEDLRPLTLPVDDLEPGAVSLKVAACGVCGSDLRMFFDGPSPRYVLPAVLGHEIVGQVEAVGLGVSDYAVGERVAVAPVVPCMHCPACLRGQDNLCEAGQVIGVNVRGGMAKHFHVPPQMVAAGGLAKVPDAVPDEAAAMTELLACCWHGLRQAGTQVGEEVLLIGEGPIGLTFVQLLKLIGTGRITVSGLNPYRLDQALALGADRIHAADRQDLAEFTRSNHYRADLAIVAAPAPEATAAALEALRPGGSLLLFSGYPHGTQMPLDLYKFHYAEKHIHGSIDATIGDFQRAMRLQSQLDMARLVTGRFPLDETPQAFRAARQPEAVKVVINP